MAAADLLRHCPMQVTSQADAERQRANVGAIVEAELHGRIFDGGWQIIPAAAPG